MIKLTRSPASPYHALLHDIRQALAGPSTANSTPSSRPSSLTEQRHEMPVSPAVTAGVAALSISPSPMVVAGSIIASPRDSLVLPAPALTACEVPEVFRLPEHPRIPELPTHRESDPVELEDTTAPMMPTRTSIASESISPDLHPLRGTYSKSASRVRLEDGLPYGLLKIDHF